MKERLRKAALWALKPLFLAAGLAAYLLIRILEPWRRIVVGLIAYDRIGHLASNTQVYLRKLASYPNRDRLLPFFVSGPPANRQLLTMIQRRVFVSESRWARRPIVDGLLPFVKGTRFHEPFKEEDLEYADWSQIPPQLSFTAHEERRGHRLLADLEIPEGAPFICFHARDKTYLDRAHPHRSREEWSYHDYRDCSIENYLPAAEKLAACGTYALRMGSVVERPIQPRNLQVIDYATRFRSDFGDVYLPAHCKFFLGCESGPFAISDSFDVPVAAANLSTIGFGLAGSRDLYIVKKCRDRKKGRVLTFKELIAMGADRCLRGEMYRAAGIEHIENTPEEILDLADEMASRIDGTWKTTPEDEELRRRFLALFPARHPILRLPSRPGARFLRANTKLLD